MKCQVVVLLGSSLCWVGGCGDDDHGHSDAAVQPHADAAIIDASASPGLDASTLDATLGTDANHVAADAGDAAVDEEELCTGGSPLGCFSARGVRDGVAFACPRDTFVIGEGTNGTNQTMVYTCDDAAHDARVRIEFYVMYGNLMADAPSQHRDLKVSVTPISASSTQGSLTDISSNFVSGHLMGTGGPDDPEVLAHVTAAWGVPGAGCSSGDGSRPCASGTLQVDLHTALSQ